MVFDGESLTSMQYAQAGLIEQGLTSHQTHYRSSRGRFYRSYDQTNSVKALKETSWSCRYGLNPTRTTPPCYNNTTPGNRLYAWRKGPNVTNPILSRKATYLTILGLIVIYTFDFLISKSNQFISVPNCV